MERKSMGEFIAALRKASGMTQKDLAEKLNDVSQQLKEHFGDTLYDTVIPRNVRLAEAPSHGLPVLAYDKQSRGALAYLALAGELSRRQRANQRASTRT